MEWPQERTDLAKIHHADGLTATQSAAILGVTRNALIGKWGRLGLSRRRPVGHAPVHVRRVRGHDAGTASAIAAVQRRRKAKESKPEATPFIETAAPVDTIPRQQRKTMATLGERHCRWPCGDPGSPNFFFCGGVRKDAHIPIERGGLPYCAAHCQSAFVAAPQRRTPYVYRGPNISS